MIVMRCTRKLLERVGDPIGDPPASTSLLGDWYAKPFPVAQRRFVLLMSGTSRLSVVMPGRDLANLPHGFPDALAAVLGRLRLSPDAVEREVEASREVVLAVTDSRSMLGSLNDFALYAKHKLQRNPELDLVDLSVGLAYSPVIAMNFGFPRDAALALLG